MIGELIQRIEDLERRLDNTVRVGRVSRADAATGRIQVVFDDPGDGGEVTTHTLPVLYPRTQGERDQWTHRPGESIVCVMLPVGQEDGFAIGAYYDTRNPPPSGDAAARIVHGDDVRIRGDGRVTISGGEIVVDGQPVTIRAQNVTIDAGATVKIGSDAASEPLILGTAFSLLYNAHTHGTGVGPSTVPIVPMAAAQLSAKVTGE